MPFDWVDALLITALLLFIFPKLLPLRYYTCSCSHEVPFDIETVRKNLDYFSPGYGPNPFGEGLAEEQPDDKTLRLIKTSKGPCVLIKQLDAKDQNSFRFMALNPETKEPLFGADSYEEITLRSKNSKTTQFECLGRMGFHNPLEGYIFYPNYQNRYYNNGFEAMVSGSKKPKPVALKSWRTELVLFFVSLAALSWLLSPLIGAVFMGVLLLHELGHALALLLMREKVLSISFVPFVGAVTYGTPPKTALRNSFYSLGGAIFSSIAILIIYAGIYWFASPEFSWVDHRPTPENTAASISLALMIGGALNLFQLLPLGFLDGGQTIIAMLSGAHKMIRNGLITLVTVALLVLAFCFLGWFTTLVLTIISVPAWFLLISGTDEHAYTPSSMFSGVAIFGSYVATVALTMATLILPSLMMFSYNASRDLEAKAKLEEQPALSAATAENMPVSQNGKLVKDPTFSWGHRYGLRTDSL